MPRVFTVFHLVVLLGIGAGLALGWTGGARWHGFGAGLAGAIVGAYAGFLVGQLPELLVLRMLCGRLAVMTADQLRGFLRSPRCEVPNLVLLELQRRGEPVQPELGVILELLGSEDIAQRGRGWAALISVFPHLAAPLGDYRVGDSAAACRKKTEPLRRRLAGGLLGPGA